MLLLEKNEWSKLCSLFKNQKESQTTEARAKQAKRQLQKEFVPSKKQANKNAKAGLALLQKRADKAIYIGSYQLYIQDCSGKGEEWLKTDRFYYYGFNPVAWWANKYERKADRYYRNYATIQHSELTLGKPVFFEIESRRTGNLVGCVKITLQLKNWRSA